MIKHFENHLFLSLFCHPTCTFLFSEGILFLIHRYDRFKFLDYFSNWSTFSSVQLLNRVWLLVTPWTVASQASWFITNSWSLLKLMTIDQWCQSTISFSVSPFSSRLQSFPASGYFTMGQLFASGGQSIGVSASTSVLPMNTQDWSPLGWTGWISL